MNLEFSFSETSCLTRAEDPSLSNYLLIAGGRIIGFIPFPRVLGLCEMQSVSFRIWTRVTVSTSYDNNHYTKGTSIKMNVNVCNYQLLFKKFKNSDYDISYKPFFLVDNLLSLKNLGNTLLNRIYIKALKIWCNCNSYLTIHENLKKIRKTCKEIICIPCYFGVKTALNKSLSAAVFF